jgi:hypothetical protein
MMGAQHQLMIRLAQQKLGDAISDSAELATLDRLALEP